jgi:hypothetical protein
MDAIAHDERRALIDLATVTFGPFGTTGRRDEDGVTDVSKRRQRTEKRMAGEVGRRPAQARIDMQNVRTGRLRRIHHLLSFWASPSVAESSPFDEDS